MLNSGIRTSKSFSLGFAFLFASAAALAQTAEPAAQAASAAVAAAAMNPYGPEALWATSDVVTKTVLLMLVVMSIGSWYIMVVKVLEQSKMGKQAEEAQAFWTAKTVAEGTKALAEDSPYRFMADAANNAVKKHEGLMGHIPVNDWVSMGLQRAVDRIQGNTQGGLAFLATVGSTSPFVGLFGTVWGIMNSFAAIAGMQNTNLAVVAPGIAEALFATAMGLVAAIPAVLAYNVLGRSIGRIEADLEGFARDLLDLLAHEPTRSPRSDSAT